MRKSDVFPTLTRQFQLAGILLTRLPFPRLPQESFRDGPHAVWAYPLIGALVGVIGGLVGTLALWIGVPHGIAAGLVLGAMMLATGAMHEDGLADTFDGLWGGHAPARRLEIMRDSQIGTYGVLALIIVTGLRWGAISVLLGQGIWALVAAAALSRSLMPLLMAHLPHARNDGLSHSVGAPSMEAALLALGVGVSIGFISVGFSLIGPLVAAVAVAVGLGALARRRIGGQTGDVLGALQQLAEVLILILLCA